MNQAEKRRKMLLEQMKALYSDSRSIPAIHPRYKAMYYHLYQDDNVKQGSLGIRIGVCVLVFVLYISMQYSEYAVPTISDMQVLKLIMQKSL